MLLQCHYYCIFIFYARLATQYKILQEGSIKGEIDNECPKSYQILLNQVTLQSLDVEQNQILLHVFLTLGFWVTVNLNLRPDSLLHCFLVLGFWVTVNLNLRPDSTKWSSIF